MYLNFIILLYSELIFEYSTQCNSALRFRSLFTPFSVLNSPLGHAEAANLGLRVGQMIDDTGRGRYLQLSLHVILYRAQAVAGRL